MEEEHNADNAYRYRQFQDLFLEGSYRPVYEVGAVIGDDNFYTLRKRRLDVPAIFSLTLPMALRTFSPNLR